METTTKKVTKAEQKRTDRENAIAMLKSILPEGKTVYTVIRHVSASGMQRKIDLYTVDPESHELIYLTELVAKALDHRRDKQGRLIVNWCGMDMCWHTVYNLSSVLFRGAADRAGYVLRHEHL